MWTCGIDCRGLVSQWHGVVMRPIWRLIAAAAWKLLYIPPGGCGKEGAYLSDSIDTFGRLANV